MTGLIAWIRLLCFGRIWHYTVIPLFMKFSASGSSVLSLEKGFFLFAHYIKLLMCLFSLPAGHAYILNMWRDSKHKLPLMQCLNVLWSLGYAVGPIIVHQFLADVSYHGGILTIAVSNRTEEITQHANEHAFARWAYVAVASTSVIAPLNRPNRKGQWFPNSYFSSA